MTANNLHFPSKNGALHVENVPLTDIAARFGTPCYVYSRAALEASLAEFQREIAGTDALVCYAVKANSNLAILNLFARCGAGFDIVSGGELQRALAAGGDPKKIVFSGVGKTADEMKQALVKYHKPEPVKGFNDPVKLGSNFAAVPKYYISTRNDNAVPYALQQQMIRENKTVKKVVEMETSHLPFVVKPAEFVQIMLGL